MIRMLGAVCLAAGPVWLGMSAAAELAHRERALGALCAGLELMERELALRLTPLPQLMEELAHRTEEPARRLFSACRRALDGLERETFAHAWRRLTDQLPVSPEAKRALYLEKTLELLDPDQFGQAVQAIAGARRELEGLRARAGEERLRLGKVYGALGVTAGAFLVILLL
mgnify:CR=1 FL=1